MLSVGTPRGEAMEYRDRPAKNRNPNTMREQEKKCLIGYPHTPRIAFVLAVSYRGYAYVLLRYQGGL